MIERTFLNPYINLVKENKKILSNEDSYNNKGKWKNLFGNDKKIFLEIGTGLGNFFSEEVFLHQDKNFIGMEIRYKRLFETSRKTLEKEVENFFLIKDFGENIDKIFGEAEISGTYIFFPDPWTGKKRWEGKRLLQEKFLEKLYFITEKGGKVFFKTDHLGYFEDSLEIVKKQNLWKINKFSYDYENETSNFDKRRITEFEAIFRKDRLKINYLELEK